uniref:Uncharacterized protein n=1 Tax=Brassica oleracea TaxID=3712 RepID=A0A3P6DTS2_BRAOL|nr:unnamed protein product [Brassica oleracea]
MAGVVGETNDRFFKVWESAYKALILSDLLGTISSYQSKATFVAYKQCSGNKMDKVNEILSLAYIDVFFYHEMLHVVVIL